MLELPLQYWEDEGMRLSKLRYNERTQAARASLVSQGILSLNLQLPQKQEANPAQASLASIAHHCQCMRPSMTVCI